MDRTREPAPESPPRVHVDAGPTCPLCLEAITALPRLEVCPACRSIHHHACVVEMGRCGTIGCQGFRDALPRLVADQEGRALAAVAWGSNLLGAAILGPFVVWMVARRAPDPFVRYHARQALLLSLGAAFLAIPTLGLAVVAMVVLSLLGALKAWKGEWWTLPLVGRHPPPEAAPRPAPSQASGKPAGD